MTRVRVGDFDVWFAEPDAQAPSGEVTQAAPAIRVAVQPAVAELAVGVSYRRADGVWRRMSLAPSATHGEVRYFDGSFPELHPGETVDYAVDVKSTGAHFLPESRVGDPMTFTAGRASGAPASRVTGAGPLVGPRAEPTRGVPARAAGASPDVGEDVAAALEDRSMMRALGRRYGVSTDSMNADLLSRVVGSMSRAAEANTRLVDGHLLLSDGRPASGVMVRVYEQSVGGDAEKVAEVAADEVGFFRVEYGESVGSTGIELRTVDAEGNEVALTTPVMGVGVHETMNLVAPTSVQTSSPEFERLTRAIVDRYGSTDALADAVETAGRRDLTLIADSTGWDQRSLAIAAKALKLSDLTSIDAEALYAIGRLGGPMQQQVLSMLSVGQFRKLTESAQRCGLVELRDIDPFVDQFRQFALSQRMAYRTPGATSTLGQMLNAAGLDDASKRVVLSSAFEQELSGGEFWDALRAAGIGAAAVDALELQARLGTFTSNNAELNASVTQLINTTKGLAGLVGAGFFDPSAWKQQLVQVAGGEEQKLQSLLPPMYRPSQDGDLQSGVEAYAAEMARRVRVAYPTQVVAEMIRRDDLVLGPQLGTDKAGLLQVLDADGFELSSTPVDRWLSEHPGSDGQPPSEEARGGLRALQRVYQITPNNGAMRVLLDKGLTSAARVTSIPRADFLQRYGADFDRAGDADLVYRKAQQVGAVSLNFVADLQQAIAAPGLHAMHGSPPRKGLAGNPSSALTETFPTLEGLFGSLDFCECEDCRSVLSPAAYLVDLLSFLDPADEAWAAMNVGGRKPYDVLTERRPDIPHILLTCENTNTTVPSIDVANEIMEFDVVGALSGDSAGDTGNSESIDLMAEPSVVNPQVAQAAYAELAGAHYPLALPFHLGLATARRFLAQLDTSFWEVLEAFAEPELVGVSGPGLQDVFFEQLGLGPSDQQVLIGSDPDPARWYELYGLATEGEIQTELGNAKSLARRLGVSYAELIRLVQVRFVNPGLAVLEPLGRLGAEINEALRYLGAEGYDPLDASQRSDLEQQLGSAGVAWLESAWSGGLFDHAVVLRGAGPECDFAEVAVVPAMGADETLRARFLHSLNLFVRVWRRLGWSIDELDAALAAFFPVGVQVGEDTWASALLALSPGEIATGLTRALFQLAHLERVRQLTGERASREELITLWAPIPTIGGPSLYERRFVATRDAYFDDALGLYLQGGTEPLAEHLPSVQSGTGLTTEDIDNVLAHRGIGLAGPGTTVDHSSIPVDTGLLSLLYRHGALARSLGLSIADLLGLMAVFDLDPFPTSPIEPLSALADDMAFSRTVEFVRLARALNEEGGSAEVLDRVFRHQRLEDEGSAADEFLLSLRKRLASVATELAELSDPARLTDELVAQKVALVLEREAAASLTAMWNGSIEYSHTRSAVPLADRLPEGLNDEPGFQLSYDSVRDLEQLRLRGMMTLARRTRVLASHPHPALGDILTFFTDQATSFLSAQIGDAAASLDFELLFGPPPENASPDDLRQRDEARRTAFSMLLTSLLGRRLREMRAVEGAASALDLDAARARLLLTETTVLARPVRDPPEPLLRSLMRATEAGLTARAFDGSDLTGNEIVLRVPAPEWEPTGVQPPTSLLLQGRMVVPVSGPYRFHVTRLAPGASVRVTVDGAEVLVGTQGPPLSGVVQLQAGRLHRLSVEARQLNGGPLRVEVEADGLPLGSLDRLDLVPSDAASEFETARQLARKVATLAEEFDLTDQELVFLLSDAAGPLPPMSLAAVAPARAIDPRLSALIRSFIDYLTVRNGWVGGRDDLAGVMATAREGTALEDLADLLAQATLRHPDTILAAAAALFTDPSEALGSPHELLRLWGLLELLRRTGLRIEDLVASATSTPDPNQIRNAVRARYDEQAWRNVAKPIYDDLRQQKRDALVAYLLDKHGYERVEELFERYLIDPGTEPVVGTSRIQLAISAVQLFIQRCLLNLEDDVRPNAVRADLWEWMKRYRVWEANRKIFLFPQNWLEPEFRDDKTHLFRELESGLLADEITDDRAEAALHDYLQGLESISRLHIVSVSWEQGQAPTDKTLHVVGRTWSRPLVWYYRQYSSQYDAWTPWEPIGTNVEGDHVVIAVWQGRVHLFWLTFLERQVESGEAPRGEDVNALAQDIHFEDLKPQLRYDARLSWSERQRDGWSEPVSSDLFALEWVEPGASGVGGGIGGEQVLALARERNAGGLAQPESVGFGDPRWWLTQSWGLLEADYQEGNRGLRKNPIHVTFSGERAIVINLNSIDPRAGSPYRRSGSVAAGPLLGPRYPQGVGFELTSKYAAPRLRSAVWPQQTPLEGLALSTPGLSANTGPPSGYTLSGRLAGEYAAEVSDPGSDVPDVIMTTRPVLEAGTGRYEIIPCSNRAADLTADGGQAEILGGLTKPFFYQDDESTFLVEPSVAVTYGSAEGGIRPVFPDFGWIEESLPCRAIHPIDPTGPLYPDWTIVRGELIRNTHPANIQPVDMGGDWLTQPSTVIGFEGALVGGAGFIGTADRAVVEDGRSSSVILTPGGAPAVEGPLLLVEDSGLSRSGAELLANRISRRMPGRLE
jgi:ABC toxin N-terminal region/Neuraminidase-like domain/Salmonella virulence plasmid 28.1kDa A protein